MRADRFVLLLFLILYLLLHLRPCLNPYFSLLLPPFILLLTFLLALKAEENTWKDWWPFNENVSITVDGGEAGTQNQDEVLVTSKLHKSKYILIEKH